MLATGTPPKGVIKKPTDNSGPAHGLTKREWFAGMALQGQIAKYGMSNKLSGQIDDTIEAYKYADLMLKQGDE